MRKAILASFVAIGLLFSGPAMSTVCIDKQEADEINAKLGMQTRVTAWTDETLMPFKGGERGDVMLKLMSDDDGFFMLVVDIPGDVTCLLIRGSEVNQKKLFDQKFK